MLTVIENLTERYARAYEALQAEVDSLEEELKAVKTRHMPRIVHLAERAAVRKRELEEAVRGNPHLFQKPRTHFWHGFKVGLQKGKGELRLGDPRRVVELIKQHLPDDVETLIKVIERPNKTALARLPAATLKKLGVEVVSTADKVVIKNTNSDIEKYVDALLKETGNGKQETGRGA